MAKEHEEIDDAMRAFIEAQHLFFVATAPMDAAGHVNVSPKGLDTLRVLAPRSVAYLDFIGSGVETIAHLRENGRIVIMFCAFEDRPKIVRLQGRGMVLEPQDPEYTRLRALFPTATAARAIITVAVERIATSCGFGVPLYRYEGERQHIPEWAERKGEDGLLAYQVQKNALSIDGLPALAWVEQEGIAEAWKATPAPDTAGNSTTGTP